jgi:hypothetical protein
MTRLVQALAAAALLAVATACGSPQSGGPLALPSAGGRPAFSVAGGFVNAGQSATFGIYVINHAADPVTLISGSLIPISGHPSGRLVVLRVGIKRGASIAGARGFPVPGVPTRPFRQARLRHGLNTVVFGFAGDRVGGYYMVAGLRIVYRYHGQVYAMNAWSASTACVVRNWRKAPHNGNDPRCNRAGEIDRRATEHMAGI